MIASPTAFPETPLYLRFVPCVTAHDTALESPSITYLTFIVPARWLTQHGKWHHV